MQRFLCFRKEKERQSGASSRCDFFCVWKNLRVWEKQSSDIYRSSGKTTREQLFFFESYESHCGGRFWFSFSSLYIVSSQQHSTSAGSDHTLNGSNLDDMTNTMNTTKMDLDLGGIFEQNATYDYDKDYISDNDECMPEGIDHFEAIFIPFLYSLAMIVGLLGNGLLSVVLFQKRRAWSVTDTFVLHLVIADSLLLMTLPFWADQATKSQGWSFGTPWCKIVGVMFTINFYYGIFLLACISLDRYLSIMHAAQMFPRWRAWFVRFSCLSVWLLSILLSIPDWVFLQAVKVEDQDKMECIHTYLRFSHPTTGWRLGSRLLYHIVGFLLPSVVLIFCYSNILLKLQRGSKGLQKQRADRVILALVVVFFLFWIPYNITLIVDTIFNVPKMPQDPDTFGGCPKKRSSLETGLLVTHALACIHSCLNPLLYFALCRNFRERIVEMLRCATGRKDDSSLSLWELRLGEELLPAQASEKVVLNQINNEQQAQSTQS